MTDRSWTGRARRLAPWLAVVLLVTGARPAAAMEATAGLAWTDVGLHDHGRGLFLSLGARRPLAPVPLDLVCSLEYVQKKGSQPTWFTNPDTGLRVGDAAVTLHCLQPTVLLELTTWPAPLPHPYAGASLVLKVSEQWTEFPGVPSTAWGYKDIDFAMHLGVKADLGPARLDLRYSRGLTDQLIVDLSGVAAAKATDPLPGVSEPQAGSRLSHFQAAVSVAF